MRRLVLPSVPLLVLTSAAVPWAATFYLHESASPVPVPGGTTTFVLDQNPPVAPAPIAEQIMVPKGTSATFPPFIAPAFPAPVPLGLDFEVVAHLSANHRMKNCAGVSVAVERVEASGARSLLARAGLVASVPQGGGGGTAGFVPVSIPLNTASCDGPFENVTIAAGESIAVTLTVSNTCKSNRAVSLAYDAVGAPGAATFDPLPPPDPVQLARCFAKCQTATSKASVKFVGTKTKCVLKCEAGARKDKNPFSDCDPPYAGATAACIADSPKGAEAKAVLSILKACASPKPCPTCYAGGDCTTYAPALVEALEGLVDLMTPAVWCEETVDKVKAKCMDANGKTLSKFLASKTKCYDKCNANVVKGKVPPGACVPPVSDPDTALCIDKAEQKAVRTLDKACFLAAAAPACYDDAVHPPAGLPSPSAAADWVALTEAMVDGTMATVYCSSPSAAFLER